MGILLSGTQLSPAIGPVVVGIIITYQTWRVAFWLLTALTGVGLICIIFFLPETFHHQFGIRRANGEKVYWIWYNPLRPMILLKYPNLLLTVTSTAVLSKLSGHRERNVAFQHVHPSYPDPICARSTLRSQYPASSWIVLFSPWLWIFYRNDCWRPLFGYYCAKMDLEKKRQTHSRGSSARWIDTVCHSLARHSFGIRMVC